MSLNLSLIHIFVLVVRAVKLELRLQRDAVRKAALEALLDRITRRVDIVVDELRSEEHTSELQSPEAISYAVFCLKKKRDDSAFLSLKTTRIMKITAIFILAGILQDVDR